MKFCESCGKEISEHAVICVNCGASVAQEIVPVEAEEQKAPKSEISVLSICGIAISAVALVAVFASVILMFISTLVASLVAGFAAVISIAGVILAIIGFKKSKGDSLSKIAIPVSIVGVCVSILDAIGVATITVFSFLWATFWTLLSTGVSLLVSSIGFFAGGVTLLTTIFGFLSKLLDFMML